MLQSVRRHVLVVLSDRVLHLVQGRGGARLHGQLIDKDAAPDALLDKAIPAFKCATRVTVVLGNPWASLELVGYSSDQKSISDPRTLSMLVSTGKPLLRDDPPAPWRSRDYRLKEHLLVASIQEPIFDEVMQTLSRHRLSVNSIQPLWSWLTTSGAPGFRTRRSWLVLQEPGFVTIAHQTRGEPDVLRTTRTGEGGPSLSELMTRLASASGLAAEAVEILSFGSPAPSLSAPWTDVLSEHQVIA